MEFLAVPLPSLPTRIVVEGEESMIGAIVVPDGRKLLYRDLRMPTLPASLRKTFVYAQSHSDQALHFMAESVITRMAAQSLKFEDITNDWVIGILAPPAGEA